MALREWIKNIDLKINVKIYGQDDRKPLFEGLASEISWVLIDLPIKKPINISTYVDNNNAIRPIITIDVIDDIENEEEIPF